MAILPRRGFPEFLARTTGNTTYLYYLGDECLDITSGYAPYQGRTDSSVRYTLTKNIDNLYQEIQGDSYWYTAIAFVTQAAIDFNGFKGFASKCKVRYTRNGSYGGGGYYGVGLVDTLSGQVGSDKSFVANTQTSAVDITHKGIYTIDKSDMPESSKRLALVTNTDWQQSIYTNIYSVAVYKEDDISGLTSYGSTVSEIIANAVNLLADETAVKYIAKKCNGEFMWKALSDSGFISAFEASPHKSIIIDNSNWNKAVSLL